MQFTTNGPDISDALLQAHEEGRVVFNIKGNDFRLVVAVHYNRRMMYVRFIGTHAEYDAINAERI